MLRSVAGDDAEFVATVLRGLRLYQAAERRPGRLAAPVIARAGRVALHDYGGEGRPMVFVPSIVNAADILDLDADRSLIRAAGRAGLRPLLVDWGSPVDADAGCSIGDHVTEHLLPLLDAVGEPPILAGYCLGGTMAIAAASLRSCRGLALLATPWRFASYADDTRDVMLRLWAEARPASERIGLLPMEVLQSAFWQIDAERVVAKFADFARQADDPAAVAKFVAVEDWSNDGEPLTHAAAGDLFESMLRDDRPGQGRWAVGGRTIDPARLDVPMLEIVSTTDRIVPAASAAATGRMLHTGLGHVGMIVSGGATTQIWPALFDWARSL